MSKGDSVVLMVKRIVLQQ